MESRRVFFVAHLKFNMAPEKLPGPNRKGKRLPTINFQGGFFVSFRERSGYLSVIIPVL